MWIAIAKIIYSALIKHNLIWITGQWKFVTVISHVHFVSDTSSHSRTFHDIYLFHGMWVNQPVSDKLFCPVYIWENNTNINFKKSIELNHVEVI